MKSVSEFFLGLQTVKNNTCRLSVHFMKHLMQSTEIHEGIAADVMDFRPSKFICQFFIEYFSSTFGSKLIRVCACLGRLRKSNRATL